MSFKVCKYYYNFGCWATFDAINSCTTATGSSEALLPVQYLSYYMLAPHLLLFFFSLSLSRIQVKKLG
jgi:hypothetical protein